MTTGVVIDLIVAVLLVATCAYCIVVARRLKALKADQESLQKAIATFDEATARAEKNLARMEKEGIGAGRDLGAVISHAQALTSELSVMVSAGDNIASRIEAAIGEVRAVGARKSARGGG